MSEFVCHLLQHRSWFEWPLGFVHVVRGETLGEKDGGCGSRRGEHYTAERVLNETSDCAIVFGRFGHLRGDKAEVNHFHILHSLKKSLSDSTNRNI